MFTFLFGLLCLLVRQLFSWGGAMSDDAKTKVRAVASSLSCLDSSGEPDFRAIQSQAYDALHKHAIVKNKKEILVHGRTREWVYDAVVDDVIKTNAGLDDGSDEADEATRYLQDRVLWGGLISQSPTGVGQTRAVQNDLVLCEAQEMVDGHKITLRFLSRDKNVVKDYYLRKVIDSLENAFKRTHKKVSQVALLVLPELEDEITKMLRVSIDTGLAALPEAKLETKPRKGLSAAPAVPIAPGAAPDESDDDEAEEEPKEGVA